ncbi:MAG: hypothetical protein IKD70_01095 [Eggerthellaceae bacterium]|nr:hypothetical protein [Eggerthellaceae bacterium]
MTFCWEMRGCDEEMQSRCPHNIPGEPCPAECKFSACDRPSHAVVTDILELLNPDLDYDASAKEVCRTCRNFLTHGPARKAEGAATPRQGNPNRFLL